jgi:lipopolysaccharide assembly outer membrane protein LptD (OstA)
LIRPRHILLSVVFHFFVVSSFSQNEQQINDSLSVAPKTPIINQEIDSTREYKQVFDSPINYKSTDSMAVSLENGNQIVYLYGAANIKYGEIELTADFISVNLGTKEIYATGITDSLGNMLTKPHFKEGSEEFDCTSLRYNFETTKGFVENVVSSQQEGKVHSAKAKMLSKDIFCMEDGKYSTCDADHPHFYLNITKGKIINKKAIIAGLSYIVVEDFPIYFPFLPYGYIPTNRTTYTSGIILPSYGELIERGFFLKDGGFYWAASDYFDVKLTGEIYSKGSWGVNFESRYKLKYKFSGSFTFSYRNLITGEKGINQKKEPSFSLRWSHSQDPKSNPSITFSSNIDFSTSGYSKDHEYNDAQRYLENSKSSSVSFSKAFANTPFNVSANMRISQNTKDSTLSISLPEMTFNMRSIQPFKRKKRVGAKRFYEDFTIAYSANIRNSITTKEKELLSTPFNKWKKGVDHTFQTTLPSFKLLKYINFTPSISYKERWFFDYLEKYWIEGYAVKDNETGMEKWVPGHVEEVKKDGFKRNYEYSYGIGSSTTLYGLYQIKNQKSLINAVRHKMDLSLSFNYHPDFGKKKYGFYDWVQVDSLGNMQQYNIFQGGIFSSTSAGESGSIGFGMNNNLEMKVLNKRDTTTTAKFKKIAIFDNIGFTGSYNLAADSMKLSPISLNIRTKIAGTVLYINGMLNPYALDSKGRVTKDYMWNKAKGLSKLGRITNLGTSLGYNFSSDKLGKKNKDKNKDKEKGEPAGTEKKAPTSSENYVSNQFKIKWGVNLNYSINYTNYNDKPALVQRLGLGINGNIDFSEKWTSTFTSGFDFETMKITNTQMTVTRNLHCWTMTLAFSPFGSRQYYMFTLSANASMLKDLKINKTDQNLNY